MRINHNIAALNTYRQLNGATSAQSKSMEKLSSGLRINRAGDDAAGLAISEKMRAQIKGLDQASANAQDGISMIQTAEGALNETHSILQRMRELANQAANDTNVEVDREEIQKEMNQLTSEINRIGNTTEFNTQKLLDGGGGKLTELGVDTNVEGGKAGKVSAVSELTASQTGKASTSITLANGDVLTFEAEDVGTNLNGVTFQFADSNDSNGLINSITRSGDAVTITADFSTGVTAAEIQTALNTSGAVPVDINVSLTNSDGTADAADIVEGDHAIAAKTTVAMTGGLDSEVRGTYTFDIEQAFVKENDTFDLKVPTTTNPDTYQAITLTAKLATNVVANSGHFSIGSAADKTTAEDQAAAIQAELMNSSSTAYVGDIYDVTVSGSKITLTEKATKTQGMGVELDSITSNAVAGDFTYTHTASRMVETGGKFTIDGVDIKVVDGTGDEDSLLVSQGKAIIYSDTDTTTDQATKLETAITNNSELNQKYSVSRTGDALTLTQLVSKESDSEPTISMTDKAGNGFEANFQIGANSGQSLTIEIADMRSQALKISGDESEGTVTAKNGKVASYVATKNVTDGSTNTNSEYALDVSTHEKASAAISVINDAIENVSAERSKLGAYQNRLEHTINNLGTSSENLTAAESRIRDVDMAKEIMESTKSGILSQAAQAMMAQANQQPQGVLQLLR